MQSAWMILAGLCFAGVATCVKYAANQFTAPEMVLFRSALPALFVLGFVLMRRDTLRTAFGKDHLKRGLWGACALGGWVYAVMHLPIALGITLNYTAPLFLAVLTTLVLKERFSALLIGAVVMGFVGIALAVYPAAYLPTHLPTNVAAQPTASGNVFAVLIGLASGLFSAFAYLNVRKLGKAGEPEWRVVFYFSVVAGIVSTLWQVLQFGRFSPIHSGNFHLVIAMGVLALAGQLCMTRAYQRGNPMTVGALSYLTIVFATISGIFVFGDTMSATAACGIALVIVSGLVAAREERREMKRKAPSNPATEPSLE
jgi:drug/metabolite transporter (DMT)-like permease